MMNEWFKYTSFDGDEVSGRTERLTLRPPTSNNRSNTLAGISRQRQEYRSDYREFKDKIIRPDLPVPQLTYDKVIKEHNSSTSLKHLTRTTLSDLQLDMPAHSTYLLLRTLEPAFRMIGFHTFVEDHAGNGTLFCAYNMMTTGDCQEVFPVGIVFIVKEPLLVKSVTGRYMLRCYSPTDIVILQEGHRYHYLIKGVVWKNEPSTRPYPDSEYDKQKSAYEWMALGNEMFKILKFIHATRFYCRGLYEAENTTDKGLCLVLHLNLSTAYLSSGWYESAIKAAERALEIDPTCLKAHFRAGRANYELRKYAESKKWFSQLLGKFPDSVDAKKELQRCESRLEEADLGSHNIYRMVLKSTCRPRRPVDCADFIGPIRMVNIPGKGRGYVATKNLNPGTLLLVSKALKAVWLKDLSSIEQSLTEVEIGSTVIISHLISTVANTLMKNPNSFSSSFYSLSTGTFETGSCDIRLFCDSQFKQEPIVHVERIRHIIMAHCYEVDDLSGESYDLRRWNELFCRSLTGIGEKKLAIGKGIFIPASFFHHRCVSNAVYEIYNDVMFVRAIQHIKEGEEVFLPGCPPEAPYIERTRLSECAGRRCDCGLCLADAKEPVEVRILRQNIIETFYKQTTLAIENQFSYGKFRELEKLIDDVKNTYRRSKRKEFQWDLSFLYSLLGWLFNNNGLYGGEVHALMNVFRTLGFEPDQLLKQFNENNTVTIKKSQFLNSKLIACLDLLIHSYMKSGDVRSAKIWIGIMIEFDRILSGGDLKSFKLKYHKVRKLCDQLQI